MHDGVDGVFVLSARRCCGGILQLLRDLEIVCVERGTSGSAVSEWLTLWKDGQAYIC